MDGDVDDVRTRAVPQLELLGLLGRVHEIVDLTRSEDQRRGLHRRLRRRKIGAILGDDFPRDWLVVFVEQGDLLDVFVLEIEQAEAICGSGAKLDLIRQRLAVEKYRRWWTRDHVYRNTTVGDEENAIGFSVELLPLVQHNDWCVRARADLGRFVEVGVIHEAASAWRREVHGQ